MAPSIETGVWHCSTLQRPVERITDTYLLPQVEQTWPGSEEKLLVRKIVEKDDIWYLDGGSHKANDLSEDPLEPIKIPAPKPRRVCVAELSQINWDDLASGREWRTKLQLRGVPMKMCAPGTLEAYLKQQGLFDTVEELRIVPSASKKWAFIALKVKSVSDVSAIVKLFHGRSFSGSKPVAVNFMGDRKPNMKHKEASIADFAGQEMILPEPRRVKVILATTEQPESGSSIAASTETSPRGSAHGETQASIASKVDAVSPGMVKLLQGRSSGGNQGAVNRVGDRKPNMTHKVAIIADLACHKIILSEPRCVKVTLAATEQPESGSSTAASNQTSPRGSTHSETHTEPHVDLHTLICSFPPPEH